MYNKKVLEKIEAQIQADIDAVLAKWQPILEKAARKQIRPTDKLCVGMGTAFIENKKGEQIAREFAAHIACYQWSDNFDTAIHLESDF